MGIAFVAFFILGLFVITNLHIDDAVNEIIAAIKERDK